VKKKISFYQNVFLSFYCNIVCKIIVCDMGIKMISEKHQVQRKGEKLRNYNGRNEGLLSDKGQNYLQYFGRNLV